MDRAGDARRTRRSSKVEDLKGKRVAVTRGTDPHIFLLRALDRFGHDRRRTSRWCCCSIRTARRALVRGDVDAWAGLDPYMAQTELEEGARLFFRDPDLNTYGLLNVREDFAAEHPDEVERVLQRLRERRANGRSPIPTSCRRSSPRRRS